MKVVRDFKSPKDPASADRLREQLGALEQNVVDAVTQLELTKMARLRVKTRTTNRDGSTVGPGQSLGITATVTRVQLDPPGPNDAGKFLAICKGPGIPGNTEVYAPAKSLINGADSYTIVANPAFALIYCDGVDFWAVT